MTARAGSIGAGLAAARPARPIEPGERIHVVGVAGAGASAAALLAEAAGALVSGCDPGAPSPYTFPLAARGIPIEPRHDPTHVAAVGVRASRLAVTKALTSIEPHHPELEAARREGVPLEAWQQVVADAAATQGGRLVAVAGTHGKSTSAGWLVHLLVADGRDPAAFVGALMPATETGGHAATARWGRGDAFVVEADEYAGNFDPYRPSIAVILNVDWDHPDVFDDRDAVVDAFEGWLRAAEHLSAVVVNVGDEGGRELAARIGDLAARVVRVGPMGTAEPEVDVRHELRGGRLRLADLPSSGPVGAARGDLEAPLQLPGAHNAANAACVAVAAALLGLTPPAIAAGLESFEGVGRRMDIKGEPRGVLVIDDYGHHPTAIRATLAAVRSRFPGRPVWVAHEPLTYHRAAAMLPQLAAALAEAEHAVIADIWAGRDRDTTITSASALAEAVAAISGRPVAAPGSVEATADHVAARAQPGDIVLSMGGGRSYVIAERLVAILAASDAAVVAAGSSPPFEDPVSGPPRPRERAE